MIEHLKNFAMGLFVLSISVLSAVVLMFIAYYAGIHRWFLWAILSAFGCFVVYGLGKNMRE